MSFLFPSPPSYQPPPERDDPAQRAAAEAARRRALIADGAEGAVLTNADGQPGVARGQTPIGVRSLLGQ